MSWLQILIEVGVTGICAADAIVRIIWWNMYRIFSDLVFLVIGN